jgi:uncharacterized protein YdeI (BOF family)
MKKVILVAMFISASTMFFATQSFGQSNDPSTTACSGTKEKILQFTQIRGPNPSFTTSKQLVRFGSAAFTQKNGTIFAKGEIATYSGVKDPSNTFCVADKITLDVAL